MACQPLVSIHQKCRVKHLKAHNPYAYSRSQHSASATNKQIPQVQPILHPTEIIRHLPPAITKHLPLIISHTMKHIVIGVDTVEEFQNAWLPYQVVSGY